MSLLLHLLLLAFFASSPLAVADQYRVTSFGAKPDGSTDSTQAFLAAWRHACGSASPATMYVPSGRFLVKNVEFQGPCSNVATTVLIDGTIVAPSDYSAMDGSKNWLMFEHVRGVKVLGGVLDGQGSRLWSCKSSGSGCPKGATSLEFSNSNDIEIGGLSSQDSQMFHIVINGCENVKVQGVKVSAPGNSPNTDGIHVQASTHVTILNSKIGTGDDCISVGPGTTNLWIETVACGPGHGISIGSLGKESDEAGVQNVTVRSATFFGTQNGVRIKTWGRPSNGFVRNVFFQNAFMTNVENPILIDQNYCPGESDCPNQSSGIRISDVTYQSIHGSSATEVGVRFDCSRTYPCTGIQMEDVKLTYRNHPAEASCINADGSASGFLQPSSCLKS
ncbi:hypothetical protein K2173_019214 [Erythroxylum novogranatense]|uniref:Polygalacturonase n=1 Tax=Erythroxylum novogranatense TaxID=1862640 RepID=A0AAV8STT9_9ROSI|nr:hypothetical protein K2173_019214 [Erythroxylum novogranatense]